MLGRLEAYYDGAELELGPRKQRAVLALLLLNANHVVSTERLIDDLWGDSPPSTARAALQVYVAGLRKALGSDGASLRTRAPGYVLELGDGVLDLERFTQLCAEARASSDLERRAALLHEALMLWRDAPLPELRTEPFSTAAVAHLEQLRLAALEDRIDADLALGREAALVTELESLVAEHPYRERLRAQLMLALYRSGRQADALDAYQAGRRVLQNDLGLEPGNELRDLEAAILRHDEALSPALPVPAAKPDQPPSTRRLSRRAVVAAGLGGLAAVALGGGITAFRLRASGSTEIHPGSVGVVDPVARRVVDEIPVGFSSALIAADESAVWLVDREGSTLTKIDPETNARVGTPRAIPAEGIPTGLAAGFGSVWIALIQGNVLSVVKLGPEFGDLRQPPIVLEERDEVYSPFNTSVKLTVNESAVWALERGSARVQRIDPATGIDELFAEDVGAASSIAVDGDAVWLGGPDGVTSFDLDTRYELGTPVHQALRSTTTSIAVGRDAVWFVGDSSRDLWRIDPVSVEILKSVPIGASPSAVAVGEDGAVWVAGRSVTSLWRLDPKTNEDETIPVGATSGGLVANFGRIWTSPGAAAG
ncbi:MAG TPA: BTAD domain-containing putative transcriptional regulator [Gaiellaceae bacterium]|nr:BTAD domain-containing putative transcriptional regulator [Gaiellaceae bacterium]